MNKVWEWIKKNPWKAISAFLGLVVTVLAWLMWPDKPKPPISSGTTDEAAARALKEQRAATAAHDAAVKKLEEDNRDKLAKASEAQVKEFEELKNKPLEEVAKWIDNL